MRTKGLVFGAGLGLGSGLMFLLDPDRGKRRRALLRDKCAWAARKTADAIDTTVRDVSNRTRGLAVDFQSKLSHEQPSDQVLTERVRAKLGRVVSHRSAIDVAAKDGCVTLRGPILASEVKKTESCVSNVIGLLQVNNELEVHPTAENNPALQGGPRTTRTSL